jgi:hypothetical protein
MELRYRWENTVVIPMMARTIPDMSSCLLYQKLQLHNCCIDRKRARERHRSIPGSGGQMMVIWALPKPLCSIPCAGLGLAACRTILQF